MAQKKKEVSVGEFDAHTGFTHVTLQRGRLMFNMGPPATKRAAAATAEETTRDAAASEPPQVEQAAPPLDALQEHAADETAAPLLPLRPPPRPQRVFRSGVFTGRSLYAEEAVYLAQRGALVVYEMEELVPEDVPVPTPDTRQSLSLAQLIALVVRQRFVTLAAIDVYAFLKDNKLHPRRPGPNPQSPIQQDEPSSPRLFLLDVFKSISETHYVAVEASPSREKEDAVVQAVAAPVKMQKRKIKRLALIFRVAVSTFQDTIPRLHELRRLLDACADSTSTTEVEETVPLKLAVADADRSVLLFEVA